MIKNLKIDPFFESTLMIIATLRNRLSTSHGAGTKPKVVSQNLARYSLNTTASAIIFLIEKSRKI
ncbi:MAG: abortive infection family protein [Chloroflexi bacterium]|nr:abortive infection family protein [Chloroflexota bacterium]